MNRLERKSWLELAGVAVGMIVAGVGVAVLVHLDSKGVDTLLIGAAVGLVAGLVVEEWPGLTLANWAIILWLAVVNSALAFTTALAAYHMDGAFVVRLDQPGAVDAAGVVALDEEGRAAAGRTHALGGKPAEADRGPRALAAGPRAACRPSHPGRRSGCHRGHSQGAGRTARPRHGRRQSHPGAAPL